MTTHLERFDNETSYNAQKNNLIPPFVAIYPISASETKIIYGTINGNREEEIVATTQIAQSITELQSLINSVPQEAPKNNILYGRKNGSWVDVNQNINLIGTHMNASVGGASVIIPNSIKNMIPLGNDFIVGAKLFGFFDLDAPVADDLYLSVKKVTGDVVGGNQMIVLPTRPSSDRGITYTFSQGNIISATGKRTSTGLSGICSLGVIGGHTILLMRMWDIRKYGNEFRNYAQWFRANSVYGGDISSNNNTLILSTNEKAVEIRLQTYSTVVGTLDVDVSGHFLLLDLTTLFPTDPDFVTSLTESDSLKVIHRLGIFAFEITQ